MNQWHHFLTTSGGHLDKQQIADFGDKKSELIHAVNSDIISPLIHMGVVKVSGNDRKKFLQGQLTNDIESINEQHSHLSGLCTPKGRLIALFRIIQLEDALLLIMPVDRIDTVVNRLRMFVMRAEVTIEDISDNFHCIGIQSKNLEITQQQPAVDEVINTNNGLITGLHADKLPRYLFVSQTEHCISLWSKLKEQFYCTGFNPWTLTEILSASPVITGLVAEEFVPQMVNLDLLGGISFTKGCYTGQEIVARMHYLGTLKRRMFLAQLESVDVPQTGEPLFADNSREGQSEGKVVIAAPHPEGGCVCLCVLRIEAVENQTIHLENTAGPELQFLPLPYSLAINEAG